MSSPLCVAHGFDGSITVMEESLTINSKNSVADLSMAEVFEHKLVIHDDSKFAGAFILTTNRFVIEINFNAEAERDFKRVAKMITMVKGKR